LLIQEADPDVVAAAFATREDNGRLATAYPDLVGGLDGAPPSLRYRANAILIRREIDRLQQLAAKVAERDPSHILLRRIEDQVARYSAWEDRQILLFDPTGDGRIVEVFGDLEAADRVAVLVPGMANDLINYDDDDGLRQDAIDLHGATCQTGVATISWLGYDTPDGVDAVSRTAAQQSAPALARFLAGIGRDKTITIVAHSYGSVLAGIAAADGIQVDNLVVVGSPGTTLAHASEAKLRDGGRVWSALAPGDPIMLAGNPLAAWRRWAGVPPLLPTTVRSFVDLDHLWHGANPAGDQFGALRITTTGSFGHTDYFTATTLANLALIVEGRYSEVELED
jgi:pimeloyl-ACP methyl ester carboxylesterase